MQSLENGDYVGDYVIIEKVGEGGICQVYRAFDQRLQRDVAIKVMMESVEGDEAISDFFEEGRAVANLNHTHIVPLYAVGIEQGTPWLAMAYIHGWDLSVLLAQERLFSLEQGKAFLQQAASALDYAGRLNLIHLDIKPANFIMDESGTILLADFGLAQRTNEANRKPGMGTPQYASPEHFLRAPLDRRTDIYSLGITLFEMLTGQPPFVGTTPLEICRKHLYAPFPAEILTAHGIPQGWINLLNKMVEKKPEDRFQTYAELLGALKNVETFAYRLAVEDQGFENMRLEGRKTVPQSGGNPATLYNLLTPEILQTSAATFNVGNPVNPREGPTAILEALDSRGGILNINALIEHFLLLQTDPPEEALELVVKSMTEIPGYKQSIFSIGTFMGEQRGQTVKQDADVIEIVGLDRCYYLAVIGKAIRTRWQGTILLNHHNFWDHAIYSGFLSEFMRDMLHIKPTGLEFLCGVLNNIGRLLFLELYPGKTIALQQRAFQYEIPLEELEVRYFGMQQNRAAAHWLRKHNFRNVVYTVIDNLTTPEEAGLGLQRSFGKTKAGLAFAASKLGLAERPLGLEEIQTLAYLTACASSLARELGLGFTGCSHLEATPWLEQPNTLAVFERKTVDATWEEFAEFFMEDCRLLPELSMLRAATAESASLRNQAAYNESLTRSQRV